MSWARIDDRYCFHRKVLAAGNEAAGAHVRMIAYACLEGTDGEIASGTALLIAGRQEVIDKLLVAVLLEQLESGDFQIHDFGDYNPPAVDVRAKREADAKRKANARKSQGRAPDGRVTGHLSLIRSDVRSDVQADGARTVAGSLPVPSPSPSPSPSQIPDPRGERERSREVSGSTPIDPELSLTAEQRAAAVIAGLTDIDIEWEKFRAHHVGKGTIAVDWKAMWTKWAVSAKGYQARDREKARGGTSEGPSNNPAYKRLTFSRQIRQPNPPIEDAPWLRDDWTGPGNASGEHPGTPAPT